jgi:hypothetical protein
MSNNRTTADFSWTNRNMSGEILKERKKEEDFPGV